MNIQTQVLQDLLKRMTELKERAIEYRSLEYHLALIDVAIMIGQKIIEVNGKESELSD